MDTRCVLQPDVHSTALNSVWRSLLTVLKELSAFCSELTCPQMWFLRWLDIYIYIYLFI
jgi:hypothetical protein